MCKKNLRSCRTSRDFIGWVRHKKGEIIPSGDGVKIYGTKPGYAELHANHTRELATGTRATLIKTLIAIGLGVLAIVVIL